MNKNQSTVKDLRLLIEGWLDSADARSRATMLTLCQGFEAHDAKTLEEFAMWLAAANDRCPDKVGALQARDIAERLRRTLLSDKAFGSLMTQLRADKNATKAKLTEVYKILYRRTGGVRPTMPRDELLQLIEDERILLDRQGLLAAIAQPAVAAE